MRGASPVERFYQAFRQLPGPESLVWDIQCHSFQMLHDVSRVLHWHQVIGRKMYMAVSPLWMCAVLMADHADVASCCSVRSSDQIIKFIKSFVTSHRFFDRGKVFLDKKYSNTQDQEILWNLRIGSVATGKSGAHRAGRWVGLVQFLPGLVSLRVQVTAVEWACIPVIPVYADWSVLLMAEKLASCGHETTDLQ